MQIVTPLVLTADMIDSPIPEPDESFSEIEWTDTYYATKFGDTDGVYWASTDEINGIIYCVGDAGNVLKIDANDDTVSISGSVSASMRAAIANSGGSAIYCVGNRTTVSKITIADDTVAEFGVISGVFLDGALANDDNIYCVGSAGTVLKISTDDDTVSEFGTVSGEYHVAVRANNGNIYCVGASCEPLEIDITNQTAETFSSSISGMYWYGGALGTDGNIYCVGPSGAVLVVDPINKTTTTIGSCNGYYYDIVSDGNGFLYAAGQNSTYMLITESNQTVVEYGYGDGVFYSLSVFNGYFYSVDSTMGGVNKATKTRMAHLVGEQVISTDDHVLYECVANTIDPPATGVLLAVPTWIAISAVNKWRMFDYLLETDYVGINKKTSGNNDGSSGTDTFSLTPGQFATTVSLYGMSNIESVQVDVYEDTTEGTLLYSETQNLELDSPFEDQLVNDVLYNSKVYFEGIEAYANPYILVHVTLADSSLAYEIGSLVIGNARTMGVTVYESSTSRTSYDTTTIDDYGNETHVSKASAEYTTFELFVKPIYSDYIERILKDSLNKKRVYVGSKNKTDKLFTFGVYERSPISYDGPNENTTTLKIRGLV